MGKLMNRLQQQLKTDKKEDAKECIAVYNHMVRHTGHLWSSEWEKLVIPKFKGFPSNDRTYSLSHIGKMYLKGMKYDNQK